MAKKKRKPPKPKAERPFDPKIASFCASHGYIDEATGEHEGRAHVVKTWGKQYLASYESGREDARKHRKDIP